MRDGDPTPLNQAEIQKLSALSPKNSNSVEEYLHGIIKSGHWVNEERLVDTLQPILSRLCARLDNFVRGRRRLPFFLFEPAT